MQNSTLIFKAVDYWMGMCMLFVFIALIEFALVNSYMRRAAKCDKLADRILYKRMTTTNMPNAPVRSFKFSDSSSFFLGTPRVSQNITVILTYHNPP